jgi:hypothetical protein
VTVAVMTVAMKRRKKRRKKKRQSEAKITHFRNLADGDGAVATTVVS